MIWLANWCSADIHSEVRQQGNRYACWCPEGLQGGAAGQSGEWTGTQLAQEKNGARGQVIKHLAGLGERRALVQMGVLLVFLNEEKLLGNKECWCHQAQREINMGGEIRQVD